MTAPRFGRHMGHALAFGAALLSLLPASAMAQFSVSSTTLTFGNVGVGATSAQQVTVTNTSAVPQAPLVAGGGTSSPFYGVTNCGVPTLPPGGTCTFDYSYSPTALGPSNRSTSITVGGTDYAVLLAGTGVVNPAITVSSTTLNFGNVGVGATSAQQVTVTNTSALPQAPLAAGGGTSSPFNGVTNCGVPTLPPGSTCTFDYGYSPTALGPSNGSASITVGGGSYAVSLSGEGVAASADGAVTPVPSLGTWSLMLLGLLTAGLGLRAAQRLRRSA